MNINMNLINHDMKKPEKPLVNWRRLNTEGVKERLMEVGGYSAASGVGHLQGGDMYRRLVKGEESSGADVAKDLAVGGIVRASISALKDGYDTILDRPNEDVCFKDGGKFSCVDENGNVKNS